MMPFSWELPLTGSTRSLKSTCGSLKQYEELYALEVEISKYTLDYPSQEIFYWRPSKKVLPIGRSLTWLTVLESQVYKKREEMGINRVYKLVDTCAAEFKAETPYYYSTFEAEIETKDGETICRK